MSLGILSLEVSSDFDPIKLEDLNLRLSIGSDGTVTLNKIKILKSKGLFYILANHVKGHRRRNGWLTLQSSRSILGLRTRGLHAFPTRHWNITTRWCRNTAPVIFFESLVLTIIELSIERKWPSTPGKGSVYSRRPRTFGKSVIQDDWVIVKLHLAHYFWIALSKVEIIRAQGYAIAPSSPLLRSNGSVAVFHRVDNGYKYFRSRSESAIAHTFPRRQY